MPDEISDHSRELASRFIDVVNPHLACITPERGRREAQKRKSAWRDTMEEVFLEALRLKERVNATCAGARFCFYINERVDRDVMYEEGPRPGRFSKANGEVALTTFPGLMYEYGDDAKQQTLPIFKAVVVLK